MSVQFVPTGTIEVPEISFKPSVQLPAEKTAIVVGDMQNDFVKPEGKLTVPAAAETVPFIQQLLAMARLHKVHIAYTQDTHVTEDPEFDLWPDHCVKGTWGWEIIEELTPHEEDLVCPKYRYDGFYAGPLDHFLTHVWNVEYVVIVGTVSNICVLYTAASAGMRWLHVVVPANGISALHNFGQAVALYQISALYKSSVVRSVEHIHFKV